ncbi:ABC transporter permease [Mesorhizobium sp. ZC-5]|uniref:ABC transporter permease n=1 Tax=Mesorhizobium sp. ZC-5 TaxID=2986066 RepID=UPI0021E794D0|nr:ABC transporter permease [Mesorhizobium sp. ZC-5]MCV3241752.1 ABC transporter permease [Mesorhizobium sp. ZC-5]
MAKNSALSSGLKYCLLAPGLLLIGLAIVMPITVGFFAAFRSNGVWTLQNFQTVLTQAPYATVLVNTLMISVVVAAVSIGMAFPVCMFFARAGRIATGFFVASMTIVLAISMLVRTYAWQVILAYNGPLNEIAIAMGLYDQKQMMLFTRGAVVVAMIQFMTPYAALILFSAMRRVDHDIVLASRTLGASWWQGFRSAYWPQVSGSVVLATVLVFSMATGFFVAPALLGGPGEAMVGTQIHADLVFNYKNGAGLATAQGVVLAFILAIVTVAGFWLGGSSFLRSASR